MGPSRNMSSFPRPSTWAERNSYIPGQTLASTASMSGVKTIPADAPKSERHISNILNQGPSYGWKGPGDGLQGSMWAQYETKRVDFQKLDEQDTTSQAKTKEQQQLGGPAAAKPDTFTWVTPSQEEKGDALGSARGKLSSESSTTASEASSNSF
ncbi:hypothetical protein EPUS_07051 [Endocarpon pusillum Z07020]|uniref:Uncharacterized protein n=1 Tax=Endocarpon pusillum (strain Z07020 / HMAS-L-300199) TaxID=1263415 RepID=U1HHZ4_ENDPU|nr:uncharacterized protein EPUS_07051 [Endocarpon pusillum Z07020]ERF69795.1 hypothetical protein EPUS_07051 [Endocarpon pusillum Z07020]